MERVKPTALRDGAALLDDWFLDKDTQPLGQHVIPLEDHTLSMARNVAAGHASAHPTCYRCSCTRDWKVVSDGESGYSTMQLQRARSRDRLVQRG